MEGLLWFEGDHSSGSADDLCQRNRVRADVRTSLDHRVAECEEGAKESDLPFAELAEQLERPADIAVGGQHEHRPVSAIRENERKG